MPLSVEEQNAELARAEEALWGWYLEWSQVARIAIKKRDLLRGLGFLRGRGGADEDESTDEPTPPVVTGPQPPIAGGSGTGVNSAN